MKRIVYTWRRGIVYIGEGSSTIGEGSAHRMKKIFGFVDLSVVLIIKSKKPTPI
jgi:hypothetical protein